MKIAIIGCGYVGGAMALFWKGCGHQVTVTTRNPERLPLLTPLAARAMLIKPRDLRAVLTGQNAILIAVAPSKGESYEETYLGTVEAVLDQIDPLTQQIIYLSSTSVYGDHAGALVDEATPPQPIGSNSAVLLQTEQKLLKMRGSMVCIFRLGEILGKGRTLQSRLRGLGSSSLPGNGENRVNLSFQDDIVAGIDFALQQGLSGIFNLCSDLHIPRKDLYEEVCRKHQLPAVRWDPSRQNSHAGNKIVSNEKIKKAGFRFGPVDFS